MSDDRFHRGRKASELINNRQKLTSYALSAHMSILRDSNALLCDPEVMAADAASSALFVGAQENGLQGSRDT